MGIYFYCVHTAKETRKLKSMEPWEILMLKGLVENPFFKSKWGLKNTFVILPKCSLHHAIFIFIIKQNIFKLIVLN